MFLKMYTGLSCPKLTEAEFQIQMANNDNTIRVSVSPSDDAVSYVSGIIIEDDYAALGENGLVSYINGLVSDGAELKAGVSDELYSDLFWHTRYYAFAGIRAIMLLPRRSMTVLCTALRLWRVSGLTGHMLSSLPKER